MTKWTNELFRLYVSFLQRQEERLLADPVGLQRQTWKNLMRRASNTEWGQRYGFGKLNSPREYAEALPIRTYDEFKPDIRRMMAGEPDVLWPGRIGWYAKSSGTTSDKSKYLPVTKENLQQCHIGGAWQTMMWFYHNRPDARQFAGKSLVMGGSLAPWPQHPKTMTGDISAIMTWHMPAFAKFFFSPDIETALLSDWEEKLDRMMRICSRERDMVMIGGVPTWTVVLLRKILQYTGKEHMLEVWPHFQGYAHGGVKFEPYREQFKQFFPSDSVSYQEVYNASEGYFATQNNFSEKGMLLLLHHGVYFEFVPMSDWEKEYPRAIPLEEVAQGEQYALVISTNAGLWRYYLGDTVRFLSLDPPRIEITGRVQQYINAFGEEVMIANTDEALAKTCEQMQAIVSEYTVAPIYLSGRAGRGAHQWLIEFEKKPADVERFAQVLDENLRKINSDYDAKRSKDIALERLHLHIMPKGSFEKWMKKRGRLGGQHKVPRLANDRRFVEELFDLAKHA